jgi:chromosome segregation ATPase
MSDQEMALRMEIREEITKRLKDNNKSMFKKLNDQILALNDQIKQASRFNIKLDQLENELNKKSEMLLLSDKKYRDSISNGQKLNHKLKILEEEMSPIKAEHAELKELNPKALKKKLDKTKEELAPLKIELKELKLLNPKVLMKKLDNEKKKVIQKENAAVNYSDRLDKKTDENRILKSAVAVLKERLESPTGKEEQLSEDYVIFTSKCGNFKVFSATFESNSHPFVGKNVNYRVLDMRDGSSLVAQWKENKVEFSQPKSIPKEVIDALRKTILIGKDAQLKK